VAIAGELDLTVADHLEDLAAVVLAVGATTIELDLTGVSFIDLRGLRALDSFRQRVTANGIEITHEQLSKVITRLRAITATLDTSHATPPATKR
jgi:anti-anti-sigma factor